MGICRVGSAMASIIDNQRDGQVREILEQRFLQYHRDPQVVPGSGDVEVTTEWSLTVPATPCLEQTAASFRRFCSACMDVDLAAGEGPAITLAIAVVVILMNLIADLLYSLLDPRISHA